MNLLNKLLGKPEPVPEAHPCIHYATGPAQTACNVHGRQIQLTVMPYEVTCKRCRETHAWAQAAGLEHPTPKLPITKRYFTIYQRDKWDSFAGDYTESLICEGDKILAHLRQWDNPSVVDEPEWTGPMQGKSVAARGKGWRKMSRFDEENSQDWARGIVYYHIEGHD